MQLVANGCYAGRVRHQGAAVTERRLVEFCDNCGTELRAENSYGVCLECRWNARNARLLEAQRRHQEAQRRAVIAQRLNEIEGPRDRREPTMTDAELGALLEQTVDAIEDIISELKDDPDGQPHDLADRLHTIQSRLLGEMGALRRR